MINTLFGSGNSLGKCRLHGASRINRARRGRCSSSSREERRVVIIPRETGHPDSSANCRWFFFFFFFLSFFLSPPGCANTEIENIEGEGLETNSWRDHFSLSLFWKVYSSSIESFTYTENFAAMYSINPDTVVLDFCPIFFPLLSLSPLFILENAHYSVVLIELRPRIFISFLALCLQKNPMEQGKPILHGSRRISRRTKLIPTQIRTAIVAALVIRDKSWYKRSFLSRLTRRE